MSFVVEIGYGVALVPLAVAGWGVAVAEDYAEHWWVAAGGGMYSLQLFLEFQGAIEAVLLFVFLALGVGLLVAYVTRPSHQSVIAACVVLLVVTSGYWNLGRLVAHDPPLQNAVDAEHERWTVSRYESFDALPADPNGWQSMKKIYWEQRRPDRCHYRRGLKQQYFTQETGSTLDKSTCGQWPFERPPARWIAGTVLPGAR